MPVVLIPCSCTCVLCSSWRTCLIEHIRGISGVSIVVRQLELALTLSMCCGALRLTSVLATCVMTHGRETARFDLTGSVALLQVCDLRFLLMNRRWGIWCTMLSMCGLWTFLVCSCLIRWLWMCRLATLRLFGLWLMRLNSSIVWF